MIEALADIALLLLLIVAGSGLVIAWLMLLEKLWP